MPQPEALLLTLASAALVTPAEHKSLLTFFALLLQVAVESHLVQLAVPVLAAGSSTTHIPQ
jgi:hypothetical protein